MNLQEYKVLLLVVTAVVALLAASPALQRLLTLPQTEFFTELWLLGPEHKAGGFPYNVASGQNYTVFLGVSNHLGRAAYYSVQVKFRNLTQSAPDSLNRTSSSLANLYALNAFVADKETWELSVTLRFDYSYDSNQSIVSFGRLLFNNADLGLNVYSISWNSNRTGFFGDLLFELWIYNATLGSFQYHERYVDMKLNMTV
jgi:uncharacterized membrane protein